MAEAVSQHAAAVRVWDHELGSWKTTASSSAIYAFVALCGGLRVIHEIRPLFSVPKIPQLAIHFFGLNIAFCRSSFCTQVVTHTLV